MKIKIALLAVVGLFTFFGVASADELSLDDLFPTDRVLDVQITVEKKDWDTIRFQQRDFRDALSERRKAEPIEGPYTYVNARVTIDGIDMGEVGIRKKGFIGSQSSSRPSLKIKLNHVDKHADIDGLSNLTLNNNKQDVTLMSQFLGYGIFNAAGAPAPRCGYAKVTVNGENLGVYSHVESVREPLLKRSFGSDKGTLYEGTVVDFFEGWENSFENKSGKDKVGREQIQRLTTALQREENKTILGSEAMGLAWAPTSDQADGHWTDVDFDDSSWKSGQNGAGFDTEKRYQSLISSDFDFADQLHNESASLYLRFPFQLDDVDQLASSNTLTMLMKYDDGFVAYLNGQRVASANAPDHPTWDSSASESHDDRAAIRFEQFDVSPHAGKLRKGKNVLAIHGLNHQSTDDDMLFVVKLQSNATNYEKAIGKVVDLDAFYRFWAVEGLLGFWDGYSGNRNNYFVYLNPKTDKFHFIPWGADCMFEKYSQISRDMKAPLSVKTTGMVAYALYQSQSGRQRYADTLKDVIGKHWHEEKLLAEIDRVETMLRPHLPESQRKTWKVDQIRQFVRERRSDIEPEIAADMPLRPNAPGPPPVIPDFDRQREERLANADTIWNAAKSGDMAAVKRHLANDVDVDARDPNGGTALMIAALAGRLEVAELLIAQGGNVNAKSNDNGTPLHGAAFLGHTEVVKLLIARGAEINAKNNRGETPLDAAFVEWNDIEGIVRFVVGMFRLDIEMEQVRTGRTEATKLLRGKGAQHGAQVK